MVKLKLSRKVKRALLFIGVVMIISSVIAFIVSHYYLTASTRYNATQLCLSILKELSSEVELNKMLIVNTVNKYMNTYKVSVLITVYSPNGETLITYGTYVPPTITSPLAPPITGSNVTIISYGVCESYNPNYIIEVKVGTSPQSLYLFITGILLLILGLVLMAIGA